MIFLIMKIKQIYKQLVENWNTIYEGSVTKRLKRNGIWATV